MSWLAALLDRLGVEKSTQSGAIHRYYLRRGKRVSVYLHHIVESDDAALFHTHPFHGLSLHLRPYVEETLGSAPRRRWFANFIPARRLHRVDLPEGRPLWTLFFRGPRVNEDWGYFDRRGELVKRAPFRGPNPTL